jgi:hypothetical protein
VDGLLKTFQVVSNESARIRRLVAATATTSAVSTTPASSATATAAATTTTAVTTATAARALFARPGFVDRQWATTVVLAVQAANCSLGLFVGGHFDKRETLAPTRVTILNDLCASDRTVLGKHLL